ncbi:MAG: hypothetical protein WCF95_01150 [bacterium]
MIIIFNPNISNKKHNSPKMANNNVAFKRDFTADELQIIREGTNAAKFNALQRRLETSLFPKNPKDTVTKTEAEPQILAILKENPLNIAAKYIAEKLGIIA